MSRRTRALLLAPVALLLVACSGEDAEGPASRGDYVTAMTETLQGSETAVDDETATCAAETLVDAVGLDAIREAGTPEEIRDGSAGLGTGLAGEDAAQVYDGFVECGIDLGEELRTEYTAREEFTKKQRACLSDVLTPKATREYFITVFAEGAQSADAGELATAVKECIGITDETESPKVTEAPSATEKPEE
ncbi:MAG: hypothetical protein ACI379_03445 [Nocardioides sp.]|uniref:hypothetical protein n=1 Tax=Nocardioides sp. TaxID=35761 RepID=UPI003F033F1F